MPFLGMRGSGDFTVTGQTPENWREMMLYKYPNGSMPLTAILSMMGSEPTDSPTFHWFKKMLPIRMGAVTQTYTDQAMSSAYAGGGAKGLVLYCKCAAAIAAHFRPGHQALLRVTTSPFAKANGKVIDSYQNGANSYVAVRLTEADDNGGAVTLASCNYISLVGSINPEGGPIPQSISYDPTEYKNYTQIFRTPLEITRTARKTKLRTGDQYKEMKREALELHGIDMEMNLIWGIASISVGANGKLERTTGGIIPNIETYAPGNIFDFTTDADFHGKTWLEAADDFLTAKLETLFKYGNGEKLALCGNGVLTAIDRLVKSGSQMTLETNQTDYGIKVTTWVSPHGVLHMKKHPLFNDDPVTNKMMLVVEPETHKYRYIDDTYFCPDDGERKGGVGKVDGTVEEFLTEAGYEHQFAEAEGIFYNMGLDHTA